MPLTTCNNVMLYACRNAVEAQLRDVAAVEEVSSATNVWLDAADLPPSSIGVWYRHADCAKMIVFGCRRSAAYPS